MMSGRTLGILLGVSVALNVFCLGVAVARARQRWEWRERMHAEHAPLPGSRRAPHRRLDPLPWLSEGDRAALRPERKALQGLRHDVAEELSAESFDAEKFRHTLEALRAQTGKVQATVHDLLIQRAQTLGPAERRKLAESGWGGLPDHAPDP